MKTMQTPSSAVLATHASERKGKPQSGSALKTPLSVKVEKLDSVRVRGARIAKEIFEEVFPHWQALVKVKSEDGCAEKARRYGLERFESGVYTPSTNITLCLTYFFITRVHPNSPCL
jgi:Fanconi-associated nuclease 1